MIITAPIVDAVRVERGESGAARWPTLRGLGLAAPELWWKQTEIERDMARLWSLRGADLARWRRIVAGTQIEKRHGVLPPAEVVHLSTAQRMEAYETFAPGLAADAAIRALRSSNVNPLQITDLVVVSCTGFSAPGVDVELIERLGLPRTVRRTMIGFMGCFGAINGMRTAVGACAAGPQSIALVVCVELCSLHMRADASAQNQVASALFADGAAAAVIGWSNEDGVEGAGRNCIGRVTTGASLVLPEGKDWMSWRITDAGFAMTLTRDVPAALGSHLKSFVASTSPVQPQTYVIHPGGPGILDAAYEALGRDSERGIEASRGVLREHGNMSSATVLFVLAQTLKTGGALPAILLAFGPGLTIESLHVLPQESRA